MVENTVGSPKKPWPGRGTTNQELICTLPGLWCQAVGHHHTKPVVSRPGHSRDEKQHLYAMPCNWDGQDSSKCYLQLNRKPPRYQGNIIVSKYRVEKWKRERQNGSWAGERGGSEEVRVERNWLK